MWKRFKEKNMIFVVLLELAFVFLTIYTPMLFHTTIVPDLSLDQPKGVELIEGTISPQSVMEWSYYMMNLEKYIMYALLFFALWFLVAVFIVYVENLFISKKKVNALSLFSFKTLNLEIVSFVSVAVFAFILYLVALVFESTAALLLIFLIIWISDVFLYSFFTYYAYSRKGFFKTVKSFLSVKKWLLLLLTSVIYFFVFGGVMVLFGLVIKGILFSIIVLALYILATIFFRLNVLFIYGDRLKNG